MQPEGSETWCPSAASLPAEKGRMGSSPLPRALGSNLRLWRGGAEAEGT